MSEEYPKGMTWINLVEKYFPGASIEECDYILWNETAFPFASPQEVEEQIKELASKRAQARKDGEG